MARRKTHTGNGTKIKVHAFGERTGTGDYRTLCRRGMATGAWHWHATRERTEMTCEVCIRRFDDALA